MTSDEDWLGPAAHATTVYEPGDPVEYTGLLDADGHPLIRFRRPIGFLTEEVVLANLKAARCPRPQVSPTASAKQPGASSSTTPTSPAPTGRTSRP